MQLDQLILFNHEGEPRTIDFQTGRLNVITGDSRTGKSSLIGIIRFLLGSASPNVPFGTDPAERRLVRPTRARRRDALLHRPRRARRRA